ncbi:efflux transporter outer membrane subunit [Paraburkholderia humisilvae]|uniref:Outer membrane protein OprJ n=1 Tax=Paraburkholderia humisilvae TaxID=627669 RepID=A0A6J5D4X1_9BURK|nr:efflux transporter outer membrane subunit [Paraburkholderia humisilvae]CAB3748993.1 Outer membrane protein OprJ [Paraburkholderia humisilvae]
MLHRPLAAIMLSATIVTVLAGCASGNDMQPSHAMYDLATLDPGQEITHAADAAHAGTVAQQWWSVFGDEQLEALMDLADQDALSLQIVESRVREASAASAVAASNLLPSIDGAASAEVDHFPAHYLYPAPYAGNYGSEGLIDASLVYHLDFWRKWRQSADAARLRVDVAVFEADDAKLVLRIAIASAWLKLDTAYRLRDVALQGLAQRNGVVHRLQVRRTAGLSTDMDAVAARDALTQTRADIARYDAQIAQQRHEIAALLGKTPAFADTLARPALHALADPAPLSAVPATLLGYRPDVAARRRAVEAAANEIGVAKAAFYPDVNLVAFAGLQSLGIGYLLRASSTAAGAGPAVTLPIFEGGRLRANLKGRVADYDEAVSAYNATIVTALQQVADGIAVVKAAREHQQEAQTAARHWAHIVDLQQVRQHSGLSDTGDLLAAETARLVAQRRATDADGEVAVAQIALIRALGGAWVPSLSVASVQPNHD